MTVIFDPVMFLDALKVIDSDAEVTLQIPDTRRATVMKTEDRYTYLAMPLNNK